MSQQHTVTFERGMVQDVDPQRQPAGSYRSASNGQLLHHLAEDPTLGHGLAFGPARGNALAQSLCPGYVYLAMHDTTRGSIVFSTNGTDSEIGLWGWDDGSGKSVYKTLYNDRFDPNSYVNARPRYSAETSGQDRLGWKKEDSFDIEVVYENQFTERIYWTARRGAMHTLNLFDAYDEKGDPYHTASCGSSQVFYPKHWSLHAFRSRSDLKFPRTNLVGRGRGTLPSGVYQIAVGYKNRNGQKSVWSPLTRPTFVTTYPLDAYRPDGAVDSVRQNALRKSHHNRVMGDSGKTTAESLIWEASGIDTRWEELRIAVLYFQTPEAPYRIVELKPIDIDQNTSLTIEIKNLQGDELPTAEFNQRYEVFTRVGALAVQENRLHQFNVDILEPIQLDDSRVSFTPVLRRMDADEWGDNTFPYEENLITGRGDGAPLTNSNVKTQALNQQAYLRADGTPELVQHQINNDYLHYKGQVFSHIYKGYFRGETYEYGAMILDRQGQPMFVQPLPAFTFPEQYTDGPNGQKDFYTLSEVDSSTGRVNLKIMGLSVSGIALPTKRLYDQDGRLNVSGWLLVRKKRKARLRHQGVVFPALRTIPSKCDNADLLKRIHPMPAAENAFRLDTAVNIDTDGADGGQYQYMAYGSKCDQYNGPATPSVSMPNYLFYHSPDVLIEGAIAPPLQSDYLQHVGVVSQGYSKEVIELEGGHKHFYTKSYKTQTTNHPLAAYAANGRPNLGDSSRIALSFQSTAAWDAEVDKFDPEFPDRVYTPQTHPFNIRAIEEFLDAVSQKGAVLMRVGDFANVDVAESSSRRASYRLMNYNQVADARDEEEKTPYFPTGHFQPITQAILDELPARKDASGTITHYVFDGVEVWGGDCYVNHFDFTRLYPQWGAGCKKRGAWHPDYAISHIVPIESKYDLTKLPGRRFAKNATKPQSTACEGNDKQFAGGIHIHQPEDWNYNRVLLLEEAVQFYATLPRDQKITTSHPAGFGWTPVKSAGQRLDNWRINLVGDFGLLDGERGAVTAAVKGDNQYLYVLQEKGFGAVVLNAQTYTQGEAGTIVTNSGKYFSGALPISRKIGCQHPESIWVADGQIGWWDARSGALCRHSQAGLEELSKTANLDDTVRALSMNLGDVDPVVLAQYSAVAGVDDHGQVYTTIWKGEKGLKTLVYTPALQAYTSELPVFPVRYGQRGNCLISVDPAAQTKLYKVGAGHNGQWFGQFYPTTLLLVLNPAGTADKTFDNAAIVVNRAGAAKITRIKHWTPNGGPAQIHTVDGLGVNLDMTYETNALYYPMYEDRWPAPDDKERLQDGLCLVELTITNDESNTPVWISLYGAVYRLNA